MRRVLVVVALVMVVAVVAAAGLLWRARPQARAQWPIVVATGDGNLVLMDEAGKQQPLTTEGDGRTLAYVYPTPAPDGRSIAVVALRQGAAATEASLLVLGTNGERSVLFDQPGQLPFYLSWAPDGKRIAFLAGGTNSMALHTAALGGEKATRIAEGEPNYFAWSPDSKRLLLHIGGEAPNGRLQLYQVGAAEPQPLETQPALFNTPAWLADGQRAFVMLRQEGATALATIDAQGKLLARLADVEPGTRFVPAPDSRQLAYFQPGPAPFGELHLLAADGAGDRAVGQDTVGAVWSPRGDNLAFLTLAETSTPPGQAPLLRWNVVPAGGGDARQLIEFRPTPQFAELVPFFDQYAHSHRLWDHDGKRLLYASDEGVFVVNVSDGATQRIGDGVLGLWTE